MSIVANRITAAAPLAAVFPAAALAQQNAGDIADNLNQQIGQLGALLGALSVFLGIAFLLISGVKFRAYSSNPQDPSASLGGSVGWLFAGSALVAIPEFLDVGVTTLFGQGADEGLLDGSNLGLGE